LQEVVARFAASGILAAIIAALLFYLSRLTFP
jgi:hypothetical protein